MKTYHITGTNKASQAGAWDIGAEDKEALETVLKDRGLKAEKIDGISVKQAKPETQRRKPKNGLRPEV